MIEKVEVNINREGRERIRDRDIANVYLSTGYEIKRTKLPRLKTAIINRIIPEQKVAWPAISILSVSDAFANPYFEMSYPVRRLRMADGPTLRAIEDPKKV